MKNLYKFFATKNRKNLIRIIFEFIHLTIRDKEIATYYFTSHAYLEGQHYRKYVSHKRLLRNGIFSFNNKNEDKIFREKDCFYQWCNENNISTVKNMDRQELSNRKRKDKKYFLKPKSGSQGIGCKVISHDEAERYVENRDYIVQELVNQHSVMNELNPTSLNTMRVHTLKLGTNIYILSAYQRMGSYGSEVDNISQGGLWSVVDVERWQITGPLLSQFQRNPSAYTVHPTLNKPISGISLPFHKESKELLKKAASSTNVKFIGWDLAFIDEGPIIIEANTVPDLNYAQHSMGGLKNNSYFYDEYKEIMSDI